MGTDPSRDNDSIAIVILVATGGLSPLPPSPLCPLFPCSRFPRPLQYCIRFMSSRLSLRKKLIYTFLVGSLLTVLLFAIVIKGIMNDYFQRLAEVRLQFVSEQGDREIRTNVAIFKDTFEDIFESTRTAVGALAESGAIGDRLPRTRVERERMAGMLQRVESEAKLSLFTVVDLEGRVLVRANDPDAYGDETLMRDYDDSPKPASSVRRLLLNALTGKTIQSFETFAPEILAREHLAEQARIQLKSSGNRVAPPDTFEERGLLMLVTMPVRNTAGKITGALLAGRLLNKELSIVTDVQKLLGDSASIFLGDVRIASNAKIGRGENKGQSLDRDFARCRSAIVF